jgi:hypothetical protein
LIRSARTAHARVLLVLFAALALWLGAGETAQAATTIPFNATFNERTTLIRTSLLLCPLLSSAPLGSVCFKGEGTGTATPPGGTASHTFTGHLVPKLLPLSLTCLDRLASTSTATITTSKGNLKLSANGIQCAPPLGETGTWKALGGTGMFAGATGGGTYVTTNVVVNLDSTLSSKTTYTGKLTLP